MDIFCAAQVGATFNPKDSLTGVTSAKFCGVNFCLAQKAVWLVDKQVVKLRRWASKVVDGRMKVGELAEGFGVMFNASMTLRTDLAKYYFAIKTYRRMMSKWSRGLTGPHEIIELPTSAKQELESWMTALLENEPATPPNPDEVSSFVMFSDATPDGWGAVLVDMTRAMVYSTGARWEKKNHSHINEREAEAVLQGMKAFPMIEGCRVDFVIDNTSAIGALKKGYSRSLSLNRIVSRVKEYSDTKRIEPGNITYVRSAMNVADGVSRGDRLTPAYFEQRFGEPARKFSFVSVKPPC